MNVSQEKGTLEKETNEDKQTLQYIWIVQTLKSSDFCYDKENHWPDVKLKYKVLVINHSFNTAVLV